MFLVLRRFALIADTLSHVAFMGVAIGLITKTFPPLTALGATTIAAVAIDQLRARRMMPGDAALAVFLYAALAIAVMLYRGRRGVRPAADGRDRSDGG
ncbi:MAG: metal ABC transporter permease [Proteobacteria bacterium]|nr:metal ABC transporter permease [Pseudomonadota bacterium]